MISSSDIEEFSVQIRRSGTTLRNKFLRILSLSSVPFIQIVSTSKLTIRDVNISSAAGIFISFKSVNSENVLKLLLKEDKIELRFSDINAFNICKTTFDELFRKVLNKRESIKLFSDNYRTSSGFQTNSCPISRNSEFMNDADNSLLITSKISFGEDSADNDDQTYVTIVGTVDADLSDNGYIDIGSRDSGVPFCDDIFAYDYEVPEYSSQVEPLFGGYESLEKFEKFRSDNTNSSVFLAMKIREEVLNRGGVKVELDEEFLHSFKVKLIENKLWVCHVNINNNNKLHVGDRIVTVNGRLPKDVFDFQQICHNSRASIIIQRLPKAKVFAYDMNILNRQGIKLFKEKLYFKINTKFRREKWKITEINLQNILNVDPASLANIKKKLSQERPIMTFVTHSAEFANALSKP